MLLPIRLTCAVVAVTLTTTALATPGALAATSNPAVTSTSPTGTAGAQSFATTASAPTVAATRAVGVGDWPAVDRSSAADGDNAAETTVTPNTVTSLGRRWAVPGARRDAPVLVAGGLVITETFASDTAPAATLVALNPATGHPVWTRPDISDDYGMIADGTMLFINKMGTVRGHKGLIPGVVALDLGTGRSRWFTGDINPDAIYGFEDMATVNGTVYAGFTDGTVVALRETNGSPIWQNNGGFVGGVTAGGGWVFTHGGAHTNTIALDAKTGRPVWSGGGLSDYQVIGGRILTGTRTTRLAMYRLKSCGTYPTTQCSPAWERNLTGAISSITGSGSLILVGVDGPDNSTTVQAFDAATGTVKWTGPAPGDNILTTAGALTYAVDVSGAVPVVLRAFRTVGCGTSSCAPVWQYRFPDWGNGQPAGPAVVSHGQLYLALPEAGLQAFALNTHVPTFESDTNGASGTDAMSWGSGRIDLFGVDINGALQHRYWRAGAGWSRWESLGGSNLAGTPAAASWTARRLDVVVRTTNGRIVHKYFNGTRWSAYDTIAAGALGDPTIASMGLRRLDVFYTVGRLDGPVSATQVSFDKSWHTPVAVPGQVYRALSAVSPAPGQLELFGSTDDPGTESTREVGGSWQSWQPVLVNGSPVGPDDTSNLSVIATAPGRLDAFFLGARVVGDRMFHAVYTSGSWQLAPTLPTIDFAGPSAVSMTPGRIDVFGVGSDYALQQLSYTRGIWNSSTP